MGNKTDTAALNENYYHINGMTTDYKAEVIAAGLIERGHDAEHTLIMRRGANHRGTAKDVDNAEQVFMQSDLSDYVHINTNRAGIYDSLPEVMFHAASQPEQKRTKTAVLQEMQRHRIEEDKARNFFRPLEAAIDHARIFVQARERMIDKKNLYRNYVDMFVPYWPIIKLLPLPQAVYFMQAVPIMRDINNDFERISQVMTGILGFATHIRKGEIMPAEYRKQNSSTRLGHCRLGRSMILDNCFTDGYHSVQIRIGPMRQNELEYFMKGADGDKILNALNDMIMPCDRTVEVKLKVAPEYETYKLSGTKGAGSRLGINTVLV